MRVLIADDEPIALERLELALACIPGTEIVASARSGKEALSLIRDLKPDIVLLDIQMPSKDGFSVIESLQAENHIPEVIFVTAFHEHAVRAFEIGAVDYLLKPMGFERVREALRRAQARLQARSNDKRFAELQQVLETLKSQGAAPGPKYERELWVQERGELRRVATGNIDRVEAEGDYVRIFVGDVSYLIKDTISSLAQRLDPELFLRVHRSSIVNLGRILRVRRRTPRGFALTLASGALIDVGPSYVDTVMAQLRARRWRAQ